MVKPLLVITAIVWVLGMLIAGAFWGTALATSLFIIGLLVIIAVNVQPKRDADEGEYVPDADLLEDFDDPYAEPETVTPAPSSIRVNPRRKARA